MEFNNTKTNEKVSQNGIQGVTLKTSSQKM